MDGVNDYIRESKDILGYKSIKFLSSMNYATQKTFEEKMLRDWNYSAYNYQIIDSSNSKVSKYLYLGSDLLMMPGDKKFKTKELSAQINSARLSFAEPEDMLKYLDIEPGSVSIMGMMNDKEHAVQLLIDEDVLKDEYIGCHPCVNTSSLKMRTDDVIRKFLPAVGHDYRTVHLVGED